MDLGRDRRDRERGAWPDTEAPIGSELLRRDVAGAGVREESVVSRTEGEAVQASGGDEQTIGRVVVDPRGQLHCLDADVSRDGNLGDPRRGEDGVAPLADRAREGDFEASAPD